MVTATDEDPAADMVRGARLPPVPPWPGPKHERKASSPGMKQAEKSAARFLGYQARWLADRSRFKLWQKSRRIGATFVQAFEDVSDAIKTPGLAVWFSSADESAAREYLRYAGRWARAFSLAGACALAECSATTLSLANGSRIHALSSNPKGFRSKGGKVVLDEFAFHADAQSLWAAAGPVVTWGHSLRVISTHNGEHSLFARMVRQAQAGQPPFSLHTTDIHQAVAEGLVSRILGKKATPDEEEAWLAEQKASLLTQAAWEEEYCCRPSSGAAGLLSAELVNASQAPPPGEAGPGARLFLGMDVGRVRDLSVIWLLEEQDEGRLVTRRVLELENQPFSAQKQALFPLLGRCLRAAIDAGGLGLMLAEEAAELFGRLKVEMVRFTPAVKEELAFGLKRALEEGRLTLPPGSGIRRDLTSVGRVVSQAGNARLLAPRTAQGHADRFWALALALKAAGSAPPPITYNTIASRSLRGLRGAY